MIERELEGWANYIADTIEKSVAAMQARLVYEDCPLHEGPDDDCSFCHGRNTVPTLASWRDAVRIGTSGVAGLRRERDRMEEVRDILSWYDDPEKARSAFSRKLISDGSMKPSMLRRASAEDLDFVIKNFIDDYVSEINDPSIKNKSAKAKARHGAKVYTAMIEMMDRYLATTEEWTKRSEEYTEALRGVRKLKSKPEEPDVITPTEIQKTKANGRVCFKPRCVKDPKVWDEKGRGWCKPHAPKKLRRSDR